MIIDEHIEALTKMPVDGRRHFKCVILKYIFVFVVYFSPKYIV